MKGRSTFKSLNVKEWIALNLFQDKAEVQLCNNVKVDCCHGDFMQECNLLFTMNHLNTKSFLHWSMNGQVLDYFASGLISAILHLKIHPSFKVL